MARGRKPALTLDEQLEKITEEIESMETSLKELKKAKKDLEEQIKMNEGPNPPAMLGRIE